MLSALARSVERINTEQISKYTYNIPVTEWVSESLFISAVTESCTGKYSNHNPPFELSNQNFICIFLTLQTHFS